MGFIVYRRRNIPHSGELRSQTVKLNNCTFHKLLALRLLGAFAKRSLFVSKTLAFGHRLQTFANVCKRLFFLEIAHPITSLLKTYKDF